MLHYDSPLCIQQAPRRTQECLRNGDLDPELPCQLTGQRDMLLEDVVADLRRGAGPRAIEKPSYVSVARVFKKCPEPDQDVTIKRPVGEMLCETRSVLEPTEFPQP